MVPALLTRWMKAALPWLQCHSMDFLSHHSHVIALLLHQNLQLISSESAAYNNFLSILDLHNYYYILWLKNGVQSCLIVHYPWTSMWTFHFTCHTLHSCKCSLCIFAYPPYLWTLIVWLCSPEPPEVEGYLKLFALHRKSGTLLVDRLGVCCGYFSLFCVAQTFLVCDNANWWLLYHHRFTFNYIDWYIVVMY